MIREAQQRHLPPAGVGAATARGCSTPPRAATDPPTFTLFATHELPPTYLRYLERKIRDAFDLGPTPIKLRVRLPQRLISREPAVGARSPDVWPFLGSRSPRPRADSP